MPESAIAVIGAGIAGLAAAVELAKRGHTVTVFEKSRGTGGRMATRRTDDGAFDHGAQYFTARDDRFRRLVAECERAGMVARWTGRVCVLERGVVRDGERETERWVGVPGMSAVCRHLAAGVDVRLATLIATLEHDGHTWQLGTADGAVLCGFDRVLVALPALQAAALVRTAVPELAARADGAKMAPCWSVISAFANRLSLPFDGAFVHGSPLSWIARDSSKPGRLAGERWVLHASAEWSTANLERDAVSVASELMCAFTDATGERALPMAATAHRWRYASVPTPLDERCVYDARHQIALAGDWCGGPRVEGAWLSGEAAARALSGS